MQSETSARASKQGGRGPSKVPGGPRRVVHELSEAGDPSEPKSTLATYRTAIGALARENVPITFKSWRRQGQDPSYVPNETKDMLSDELNKIFQFPKDKLEIARKRALNNMGNAWRHWKTTLNRDYVKKGETPSWEDYLKLENQWEAFVAMKTSDEASALSAKNKANSDQNKYPHRLGPGGYTKQLPKWEAREQELELAGVVPETSGMSHRSKTYMLAWGASLPDDGSLTFKNETATELARKIVEAHENASQGEYLPIREEDELTRALGTKEHPGRARGIGSWPWKAAFPDDAAMWHKPRATRKSASLDAIVEEVVGDRMRTHEEAMQK